MRIKIAFIISGFGSGGAQSMLRSLATHMNREEFDIRIFVRGFSINDTIEQELTQKKIPVEFLSISAGGNPFYKLKSYIKFKKSLDQFNPDIIHCHLESIYTFLYAIQRKKKLIVTIHSWPDRIVSKMFLLYIKLLVNRNQIWTVGCANAVTDRLIELVPILKDHSATIYNPVVTDSFYHSENHCSSFTFIHIGRLTAIKNQKLLLDAFSLLKETGSSARLIICGDGELRDQLVQDCKYLNITDEVDMLGNRDDIPEQLSISDAFVLTSDSECCPMVIIEALASGIPVITTDVGGAREVVGNAGICVEKGNKDMLFNAMKLLSENKEIYQKYSNETENEVRRFEVETIVQQYQSFYRKVYSN